MKRATGKKSGSRGASARKKTGRKKTASRRPAAKTRTRSRRKSANALKKRAAQGVRAASSGVKTMKRAGDKIWESLRATTTQVVGGVRDRLADDDEQTASSR